MIGSNNNMEMDTVKKRIELSAKAKWTLTAAIYFSFFIFGLLVSFFGPALLDLADKIGSDVDNISTKASIPSAFVALTAAIGIGFILRFLNRQWYLIASYFVCAMTAFWLPNSTSITSLALCLATATICYMGMDITSNAWLLAIWRGGSTHLLQGLHFTWAFGSAVAPLVMAPFLSVKHNTTWVQWNETAMSNETLFNVTQTVSYFYQPYYVAGAIQVLCAAAFVVLYFTIGYDESNEKADSVADTANNAAYTFTKMASATVIGLGIFTICAIEGAEVSTGHYMPTMIVGLGFSKAKGAYMSSARAFVYTFSRVIAGFSATKVPIKLILFFSFFTVLGGNAIVIIGSNLSATAPMVTEGLLWIGFCLIGLGFGPIHPGIMSFTESYVKLTDFTVGLFVAVGSVNVVLNYFVVGHWVQSMPIILIYYILACVVTSFASFLVLLVFIKKTANPVVRHRNKI